MTGQTIDERELRRLRARDAICDWALFRGYVGRVIDHLTVDADLVNEVADFYANIGAGRIETAPHLRQDATRHVMALQAYRADLEGEGGE